MRDLPGLVRALLVLALLGAPLVAAQNESAAPEWADGAYNPFGHLPILVRIDASNLTKDNAGYLDSVHLALRYWELGGNGRLAWTPRFAEVQNASDADVVLWFRDASRVGPTCEEQPHALGCARPFERPVSIEIVARLEDRTFRSYQQIKEVTEHEVGHAIGLPHSASPGDIMAPNASALAAQSYRPGDWWRALLGVGALALIALVAWWALRRVFRPVVELGRVGRLAPGERCTEDPSGEHDLEEAWIDVRGKEERWLVCSRCKRGFSEP